MKKLGFRALVLTTLILSLSACAWADTAAPAAGPEAVIARVGGKEITLKDVKEVIGRLDPQRAALYDNEIGRKAIAEELVNMELLLLLGGELEVEKTPEFAAMMDDLKKDVVRRLAIDAVMKDVKVGREEAAEYYEKNRDRFAVPETVRASHILVDGEEEMARVKADLEGGMSFEDAAKKYSTCDSAKQGGDLGFFSKREMVKEFADAAFAMKTGEVTEEPVKTEYGLHLIKLTDRKEASVKTLEEVEAEITEGLENEKKASVYRSELARLKEKYGVEFTGDKKDEAPKDDVNKEEEKTEDKAEEKAEEAK
jgi:peptidyl-prolyl cis-trans isomerase C